MNHPWRLRKPAIYLFDWIVTLRRSDNPARTLAAQG